jgi:hypothetical protein
MQEPTPARGPIDVGLVTYEGVPELSTEDQLLIPALARHGLRAGPLVWDDPAVDWAAPRLCVIRSTWDYLHRRDAFVAWAERVAGLTALWNPAPLVRWNTHKGYLRDLAGRGVPVVPTVWLPLGSPAGLAALMQPPGWARVVIKPAVSADSFETRLFDRADLAAGEAHLRRLLATHDVMVQPFIASVVGYGERSLLFIDGDLTHAVRRAAPSWGAPTATEEARLVTPAADEAVLARAILRAVGAPALYARVDLVRDDTGALHLLELELVEPSLFLALAPHAVARLAAAIARYHQQELAAPS